MEPADIPKATEKPSMKMLQFRNGLYQGQVKDELPNGKGLMLDDYMRLYVSQWQNCKMNGRSIIFNSHSKYMYGLWSQGLPNGFIIYRSGDIVILGHYFQGKLNGQFLAVFERQNFLAVVEATENQYKIKMRFEFTTEQDIKRVSETMSFKSSVPRDYFSLIKFAKISFVEEKGVPIKFTFDGIKYQFGFENGLGIVFNDQSFISKVGVMDSKGELKGIGASYGTMNEQGNFDTKSTVQYKSQSTRPESQIKTLLRQSHRQSINFVNSFVDFGAIDILKQMDDIVRDKLIVQLAQEPSEQHGHTQEDLNDSLEYYPKDKDEVLRLRMIREGLYRSVTPKIGTQMVPLSRDPSVKSTLRPNQGKQLHYTPTQDQPQKPYTLQQSHKKILEDVLPLEYESVEKRRHRLMVDREIGLYGGNKYSRGPQHQLEPERNPEVYQRHQVKPRERTTSSKNPTPQQQHQQKPVEKIPEPQQVYQEEPKPNHKHHQHTPHYNNIAAQFARKTVFHKTPQVHHHNESEEHEQSYQTPKKEELYPQHPKDKQRTTGKMPHAPQLKPRQYPRIFTEPQQQQLPRFKGPADSPYHQITMSEDTYQHPVNTASSRKLIPIVHQPEARTSSKSPLAYNKLKLSPAKYGNSYQEIYRREQVLDGRSPARDGTIRTVHKSPVKATSPIKTAYTAKTSPGKIHDSNRQAYTLTHPAMQSYPMENVRQPPPGLTHPSSNYPRAAPQRTTPPVKKYDYIRQL